MAKQSATHRARDGARRNTRMRLEQWSHNPVCEANTISAVRNVRMADVAKALGIPATFGQSPFAIARGEQFEKSLFYKDAERLVAELIKTHVLPTVASQFVDLRIRMNGGTRLKTLDEAIEETRELIRRIATESNRSADSIVAAGATVRIPKGILLPEAILIIDALSVRFDGEKPKLIVGEIKTYPDRGGHTDGTELALARAQAGIYVHGLELVVSELDLAARIEVSNHGFLVLTRPGSNQPSVRPGEDLRYQAERAKRGFELLERAAAALSRDLWAIENAEPPTELIQAVVNAKTDYNEACLAFCDLASRCFDRARQAADPVTLGEDMRRFLGAVDLTRASELLNGSKPHNEAERDLRRRIEENDRISGT